MKRLLACALLLACDHRVGVGSTVRPGQADRPVAPNDEEVFVRVSGRGATEDDAYAQAVRALAVELLGDARWLDVAPVELHERPTNLDAQPTGDGIEVRLELTHSEAAAALAAFEDTEPNIVAPEPWHETMYAYLYAHIREHACVRKHALFGVACETGTTADADAALQALAAGFVLASSLRGGVPVDAKGRPLREPDVLALSQGTPVAGVPLRVELGSTVTRVYTNEQGRVPLCLPDAAAWPDRVRVAVDAEAMLGPVHAAWPGEDIEIASRPLDLRRWTIVIADDSGKEIADGPRDAFVAAMRGAGFGDPKAIRDLKSRVRTPARLVETTAGEVDLVVLVEVSSAYASRVGGGRVWYEAKGKVRALNPWKPDDTAFPSFTLEVTASDVGDARAEQAARTKLCADAGEKLAAMLARKS